MKRTHYAKQIFIILWILWTMLCVRFSFKIGLIGFENHTGNISTILFICIFCLLIPISLLIIKKNHVVRLIWVAIPLLFTGIITLLILSPSHIYISSVLLAAGSALLTVSFLYIYAQTMSKQEQLITIIVLLILKPIFSLTAVLMSDNMDKIVYIMLFALVLISIAICSKFLTGRNLKTHIAQNTGVKAPFRTLLGIYVLFSLIVFERMNCVFMLSVQGYSSSISYYFYFAGGGIAAFSAWWLFKHKKLPISRSFDIFLFAAIFQLVFSLAAKTGIIMLYGIDMIFFGVSDIIYVFLFVTAASLSTLFRKEIFVGFVCVFGFSLICSFGLSHFLYIRFQSLYSIIYALTSLIMIASCFLFAPLLRNIDRKIYPQTHKAALTKTDDASSAEKVFPIPTAKNLSSPNNTDQLTLREAEVVDLYLKGYSNAQIADMMNIAPSTVKVHSRNIYEKLNVRSRIEILLLYQNQSEKDI